MCIHLCWHCLSSAVLLDYLCSSVNAWRLVLLQCLMYLCVCFVLQALSLSEDVLDKREVIHLDIANDDIDPRKYKREEVSWCCQPLSFVAFTFLSSYSNNFAHRAHPMFSYFLPPLYHATSILHLPSAPNKPLVWAIAWLVLSLTDLVLVWCFVQSLNHLGVWYADCSQPKALRSTK